MMDCVSHQNLIKNIHSNILLIICDVRVFQPVINRDFYRFEEPLGSNALVEV